MTDTPPGQPEWFSFLVDLGAEPRTGGRAGFEACSIGGVDATLVELPLAGATSITLERGVVDSDQLTGWLGDRDEVRTVRVELRSEDRTATVATWTLAKARINRLVGGRLADDGSTDLAVDELTLAGEALVPDGAR